MNTSPFIRRLGAKSNCLNTEACPALVEMSDDGIAIIGLDITAASVGHLPQGVGCGHDEKIVRIPREVLLAAYGDLMKS